MHHLLIVIALFLTQAHNLANASSNERIIIGWIETVRIMPEKFDLVAKIDTGADNSSLDVAEWHSFMRDDTEWLRFSVKSNNDEIQTFERPLVRYAYIKRKRTEPVKRPVVTMQLCIGNTAFLAPVNLAKRHGFTYRMLIGRSFLQGSFLVDSALTETVSPKCDSLISIDDKQQ